MMNETIPGTKALGARLANAELNFLALIMESGFNESEAVSIFKVWKKNRCVKREGFGRWVVKHGGFWEKDAMNRALALA